jgi:S-adenosylmethionine-diacylglycerol 3-amino-3-carboxypropyl transferase
MATGRRWTAGPASSVGSIRSRRFATRAEAADHADFSEIRYAQCWEDADVLLEALRPQRGQVGISIASGGENTLALLASGPARVIALDLNPAQIACLELKVAAFRELRHHEVLALIGSEPATNRGELYKRCRTQLSPAARRFWDNRGARIDEGIGAIGKFERYFELFRGRILPLVHRRATIDRLLAGGPLDARERFYEEYWNSWRWRAMFRLFFSRTVMGRFGRDPSFFRYVEGTVSNRILARTRHALTRLNPAENPYLQWILTGRHASARPYALRPEHFDAIRAHLDRLEWRCMSMEEYLGASAGDDIDWFNLSDIFEYMSMDRTQEILQSIAQAANSGARLAYWNTLVPRSRAEALAGALKPLNVLAGRLHEVDKAFFYSAFVVEEVM